MWSDYNYYKLHTLCGPADPSRSCYVWLGHMPRTVGVQSGHFGQIGPLQTSISGARYIPLQGIAQKQPI